MTKRVLKNIVALLIICGLLYLVDLKELGAALGHLTIPSAIYLMLISFALIYISALKWSLFLEALSQRVAVIKLFVLYIVGYFVNLLLPSFIGGDALRSWYVGKKVGQHEAAAATILERYTGFVAMIGLALICMWSVDLVTLQIRLIILAIAAGLIVLTIVGLSPKLLGMITKIPQLNSVSPHLKKIQDAFHIAKNDKPVMIKALLLSFLFHMMTVVNTVAAAYAVGWYNPPIGDLFVVLPIILLLAAIPITPNGLGLQEGAFLYFLTGLGATPEQALGVAVILRAKTYILAIIGGCFWLVIRKNEKSEKALISQPAPPEEFIH